MTQPDLGSPDPSTSHEYGAGPGGAAIGLGQLEARGGPLDAAALAALFPEFSNSGALAGLGAWIGSRHQRRMRKRAAALGIPVIAFDHGLLRAPPWRGGLPPVLSVTAAAMRGPGSPADILCADRVLATRGWETADLLARAAAGRQ